MALFGLLGKNSGHVVSNVKKYQKVADSINALEDQFATLSDAELQAKTAEFKKRLAEDADLNELLPEAFATVREVAKRLLNQRHYDVQLIGGQVLHEGKIAEMRTGEGKTLTSTLPIYLNALTGKGVHVVTVNDYLARRDAVWMGQIFDFLGLSLGVITSDGAYVYDREAKEKSTEEEGSEQDEERDELGSFKVVDEYLVLAHPREAYAADVTYGTNAQFGFDYLRDNTAYRTEDMRQRGHAYAIVDEIDSILIDEARVPLILSTKSTQGENLYQTFADIARVMEVDTHFEIDAKRKQISISDAGIEKAEDLLGVDNIYTEKGVRYVHHLENALYAKALKIKDKDYVVRDGKIVIVDEFTGRMLPGRQWSKGIHQAVEAKEGLELQQETRTFASITYQNFFRLYDKLAGMTGTAETSAEEFYTVYGLDVVTIPTNQPVARIDNTDLLYQNEAGKFKAIAAKVKELHDKGQPVLIGTVSIEKNELLSQFLREQGVPHEMLNAKNHAREGEIIAQAGRPGAVTIATNMAGRGVDIKLGGNPATTDEEAKVKEVGGLFVLGTERHDARRIDNQLRGRSGRQGDPGETQFYISFDDDLLRRATPENVRNMLKNLKLPEEEAIKSRMFTKSVETAQRRIEGMNFDSRKAILQYDSILDTQRKKVYVERRKLLGADNEAFISYLNSIVAEMPVGKEREKAEATVVKVSENEEQRIALQRVLLRAIDLFWMDHLDTMDSLRSSVNLRAYGQRDPLVEYKTEGLRLFREMQQNIRHQSGEVLATIEFASVDTTAVEATGSNEDPTKRTNQAKKTVTSKEQLQQLVGLENIGRNDKVVVAKGDEKIEIKWKRAEEYLKDGWQLVGKA